jgi:hypothetical protein
MAPLDREPQEMDFGPNQPFEKEHHGLTWINSRNTSGIKPEFFKR